ncbi:MAG TPA: sugar ABC transporter substrate-binding protein [Candidatus Pullichristensenella excrementigallinarum]|uniref:Sugar ABC transporter substrate-binding protein n=1 Tax=Candidatus Pullichristensenella excrementigallinarum TaxID=2840907 RepID=A0A9D1LBA8_9FIRM|nr:sugar ABC transporter substrate-binding protein [Candidatus Pullichristensenella excrementigallinarum]
MKKILSLTIAVLLLLTMCVAGVAEEEGYLIAYVPTTMNNAFWLALMGPIEEEVEARGDTLVTVDAQSDQATMNNMIGDLIVQGIDVLLVAPQDSTAVETALVACADAGIPVINFDTPVTNTELVKSIIASDNYNAGVVVGKDMMEKLPEGSKVAVMHSPAGGACIDRANGFYDTVGEYFEIVVELDGKGDTGVTMPLAEDVLQSTPDLAAFFCVNDPSAIGAVNALAAYPDMSVLVYGVDGNPDAKALIEAGRMEGTAAQSPETIGRETIAAAYELLAGNEIEPNIVVDTFLITADNVAEYGTEGWQ